MNEQSGLESIVAMTTPVASHISIHFCSVGASSRVPSAIIARASCTAHCPLSKEAVAVFQS